MSEMVERVAAAMFPDWFDPAFERLYGEDVAGDKRSEAFSLARAAIAAMREPTVGMLEAGQVEVNLLEEPQPPNAVEFLARDEIGDIWQAMIDAALSHQGNDTDHG